MTEAAVTFVARRPAVTRGSGVEKGGETGGKAG